MAMDAAHHAARKPLAPTKPAPTSRLRQLTLHLFRWGLLVSVVWLLRTQHIWWLAQMQGRAQRTIAVEQIRRFYPAVDALGSWRPEHSGQTVLDGDANPLGYVIQSSPASDSVIGYSGPTNVLIAFDTSDRILGIEVLDSGDTYDHLAAVLADERFMESFTGLTWDQARNLRDVDGVSGATLTSMAIVEGIALRLGGAAHSYRFPQPPTAEEARAFFPDVVQLDESEETPGLYRVQGADARLLGFVMRTSPTADDLVGFQGPTDTLVALDLQQRVTGIAIRDSYETQDNPDYVGWVRDDKYFMTWFNGKDLDQLATVDSAEAGIEGVSGATMTSMSMVYALAKSARRLRETRVKAQQPQFAGTPRDVGTVLMVLFGLLLTFTTLRGKRSVRVGFQLVLIVYLGLMHGEMISQVLLVGWVQNGVAWRSAPGLVAMLAAAFIVPLVSRRQFYCHHLCPHGAAQQLVKNVVPYKLRLPRWFALLLRATPVVLLGWVLAVAVLRLPFNLAAIEPFDAYLFRIAGWATLSIAMVGLAVSTVVPMAYCRFGCPTGTVLDYLRLHGRSDRFTRRDWVALVLVTLAVGLIVWARHSG
jgi:transcriptional regulator of nitric oxide reductase